MKYNVYLWCGSGYQTDVITVEADCEEQAVERAVVEAEMNRPYLFFDDCENLEQMEEQGEVLYIDATMEGAQQPHYIDATNLRIEEVKEK